MAYYREMRVDEISAWLLENQVVELTELEAVELAEAILDRFDIMGPSNTAQ